MSGVKGGERKNRLRFLPVILVGALSASASFAAGAVADFPAVVELALVGCLALLFATVLADTVNTVAHEGDPADLSKQEFQE